jgi:predicted dinucleotide-binding enzyme
MQNKPTIAVIGGTGDLGSGLARLWAAAGYPIIVGSRAKEKALAKAQELTAVERRRLPMSSFSACPIPTTTRPLKKLSRQWMERS